MTILTGPGLGRRAGCGLTWAICGVRDERGVCGVNGIWIWDEPLCDGESCFKAKKVNKIMFYLLEKSVSSHRTYENDRIYYLYKTLTFLQKIRWKIGLWHIWWCRENRVNKHVVRVHIIARCGQHIVFHQILQISEIGWVR